MPQASRDNLKRNLIFNTAGNLIYFLCQWMITGLLVKSLADTEDSGIINAGMLATASSVTNMFMVLAGYGMRNFQVSDINGKYSNGDYIRSRVVTVALSFVLVTGYVFIVGYSPEQTVCIFLFYIWKIIESVTDVFHGIAQRADRMDIIGISYAVRGILSVGGFAAVYSVTGSLNTALGVYAALCLVFSAWYDIFRNRGYYTPMGPVDKDSIRRLLIECLPLALYAFCTTTTGTIPKLFLGRIWGDSMMGIYGLVDSPVLVLQVGVALLFGPFVVRFARMYNEGNREGFLKLTGIISACVAGLTAVCVVGAMILGKFGLRILYGSSVAEYDYLLPLMVICAGLTALMQLLCTLLTVVRCMKGLLISTASSMALSAAASMVLVPRGGLTGTSAAAITAIAFEIIMLGYFLLKTVRANDHN